MIVIIPFLGLPLTLAVPVVMFVQFEKIKLLRERGVEIMGEVTGKRVTPEKNNRKAYHIDYRFNPVGELNGYHSGSDTVPDTSY
jgi:hypothetical protein